MNNNIKFLSIPILLSAVLFGGLWMMTESATASSNASFIAPPGPICRNGASGNVPDFNLTYASTGSGGMDLAFSLGFAPQVQNIPTTQGYIESIPTIRFKPKLNSAGQRVTDEYWLVRNEGDLINYSSSQLDPYLSEPADAPAPYTTGLGPRIRANPGNIWIVGNEVDRDRIQDSLLPETYARAYHDSYAYIKSVDPTAQIAVSGLVNFSPGRRQYLDLVVGEYQRIYGHAMPVDIWTMHAYNLWGRGFESDGSEDIGAGVALGTDPNLAWQNAIKKSFVDEGRCKLDDVICIKEHDDVGLFQYQVVSMRQWMKDHGYQEKPLMLTEWGLNLNSDLCDEDDNRITAQRAAGFLTATVNWMDAHKDSALGYSLDEGRLVQRWAWFGVNYDIPIPGLADVSHLLTDYTINYPSCGSQDFPSKIANAGNNNALTVVGQAYKNVIAVQNANTPPSVDFVIDSVSNGAGVLMNPGDTVTTTIGLSVRNVGNSPTGQNTTVEFRDASNNSVIGTFIIPPNFQGCTTALYHGSVTWPRTAEGTFNFNVTIQSPEETGAATGNNFGSGTVFVGKYGVWLPLINK